MAVFVCSLHSEWEGLRRGRGKGGGADESKANEEEWAGTYVVY